MWLRGADTLAHNLFISHSWAYSDAYDRLTDLLRNAVGFSFIDHSVPKDDPIHNAPNDAALRQAIQRAMAPAQVVLVMAGVYATYSRWINVEVAIAHSGLYPKPVIAIEPWGSEKTSKFVKDNADRIVGWNANSVVAAVRELS